MNRGARDHFLDLVRGTRRGAGPALQRFALRAASVPYGAAIRGRNALYDCGWLHVAKASLPVVSVGNLTAGGTGKTPCVEHIAARYREQGLRVAILSRGYGANAGPNDEALVLEENLPDVPHLQGADRVALAQAAAEELESEVLVLDDGFQHRRLARDLDLVLIDATCPWGHGHLLPRGLLREPVSSLRRAHAVVLTRCDQVTREVLAELRTDVRRHSKAPIVETTHAPVELLNADGDVAPLSMLHEQPIAAFAGIGNPESFERTLRSLGANVNASRTFADHHAYTRSDVDDLTAWAATLAPDAVIATTQKDLVKLRLTRLGDRPLWCLRVKLRVESGGDELHRLLDAVPQAGGNSA